MRRMAGGARETRASIRVSIVAAAAAVLCGSGISAASADRDGGKVANAAAAAIDVGGGHSCALLIGVTVMCWGDNQYGQVGDGTTAPRLAPVRVLGLTS